MSLLLFYPSCSRLGLVSAGQIMTKQLLVSFWDGMMCQNIFFLKLYGQTSSGCHLDCEIDFSFLLHNLQSTDSKRCAYHLQLFASIGYRWVQFGCFWDNKESVTSSNCKVTNPWVAWTNLSPWLIFFFFSPFGKDTRVVYSSFWLTFFVCEFWKKFWWSDGQ